MRPTLYIDIETIPAPEEYRDGIEIKAPAQYKKPESIQKWIDDNGESYRDEQHRKTSFNGGYGDVCAVAWAIDDGEIQSHCLEDRIYAEPFLNACLAQIDSELPFGDVPEICGHFVAGFDMKFIRQRCIVLGIPAMPWVMKDYRPWEVRDTMTLWAGVRDTISLDELCEILGIEGKGDMDGSQVYDAWLAGEYQKISDYCADDVRRVREIDLKFRKAGV